MFDIGKINVVYEGESEKHYDKNTGQILSRTDVSKRINDYLKEEMLNGIKGIVELDGMIDFRIVRAKNGAHYHVINVKANFDFIKTFKKDLRDMFDEIDLSPHACKFMYMMTPWIHYPENTIVYKKKNPSIDKLCEVLNLKRAMVYRVLKELEDCELIRREKLNGQLIIYINPFLHSCGWVSSETIELFKDSQYNHEHLYH